MKSKAMKKKTIGHQTVYEHKSHLTYLFKQTLGYGLVTLMMMLVFLCRFFAMYLRLEKRSGWPFPEYGWKGITSPTTIPSEKPDMNCTPVVRYPITAKASFGAFGSTLSGVRGELVFTQTAADATTVSVELTGLPSKLTCGNGVAGLCSVEFGYAVHAEPLKTLRELGAIGKPERTVCSNASTGQVEPKQREQPSARLHAQDAAALRDGRSERQARSSQGQAWRRERRGGCRSREEKGRGGGQLFGLVR